MAQPATTDSLGDVVKGKVTEDPVPEIGNRGQSVSTGGSTTAAASTSPARSGSTAASAPSTGKSAATAKPSATDAQTAKERRRQTFKDAGRELLLVALLFGVYKLGRGLVSGETSTAFANAKQLLTMQKDLRLPDEAAIQDWFMQSHTVVLMCNKYYAYVHFPATIAFLVWLWIRHRNHYKWVRNVLAVMTGAALIIHILVPLAPPRMMPGFTDTGKVSGDSPYAGTAGKIANQFAAMPSLHVGWAVVVALGVAAVWQTAGRGRRVASWAVWLHPAITLLVVVVTANHYWLDAVVAVLLMVVALAVLPAPEREPHVRVPGRIPAPRTAR